MISIRKVDCPTSKISIKCPYLMTPEFIIIHNTANDASAADEISHMHSNADFVSFHIAVDDKEAVQGIDFNRNTWNAGDGEYGNGNRKGIAIEICYSKSGGAKFENAQKNAAELTAKILKDYDWNIHKVKKHQDFSSTLCPHRTLQDYGWEHFLQLVQSFMGQADGVLKVGDLVSIRKGAKYYNGKIIPTWVLNLKWFVSRINGDRVVINESEFGKFKINSPVNIADLHIETAAAVPTIRIGSTVKIKPGAKTYTGESLANFVYKRTHKVKELQGNRAVVTYLGIVVAAIHVKDLIIV